MTDEVKSTSKDFHLRDHISLLEANKSESFYGMRAYHESERSHINNALQLFWRSALPAITFPNFALLFANPKPPILAIILGASIIYIISILIVGAIYFPAKEKIISDHGSYNMFGKDYARTTELLHFLEPIKINEKEVKIKSWPEGSGPGTGSGYEKSINVLKLSARSIILISSLYLIIILGFNFEAIIEFFWGA